MASHASIYSDHKALSAIGRNIPRLIQVSSSPVISVNFLHKIINLGMLRSSAIKTQNERLDGLLSSDPLLSGIQARDHIYPSTCSARVYGSKTDLKSVFTHVASSYANLLEQMRVFT